MKKPKPIPPNTTRNGGLACANGFPWLDHFDPPIGTGTGCLWCEVDVNEACERAEEAERRAEDLVARGKVGLSVG